MKKIQQTEIFFLRIFFETRQIRSAIAKHISHPVRNFFAAYTDSPLDLYNTDTNPEECRN